MEFHDLNYSPCCDDNSIDGPYAFRDFMEHLQTGVAALAGDMNGVTKITAELEAAGFINVKEKILK